MKNVKNFSWGPTIGSMCVAVAVLSGCGGSGSDSSSTSVRVVNATLTHASLDLYVNAAVALSGTAKDAISSYVSPGSGSTTLQVTDNGSSTSLATVVPTLSSDAYYTLVAYESGTTVKTLVVDENATVPSAGVSTLRVYDAAIEAGKLDVYVTTNACSDLSSLSANTSFGILTAPTYNTVTMGTGTYNVCVTAAGSKTDLRMSMAVTLTSQEFADVVLTPTSGGQLVNGALLVQQGSYTAARNTNTRVRLASAVSGSATVAASATSGSSAVVIDSGSVAPAFGYYTLVPAGSSLNISVNSASVSAPSTALTAGADMTLLVYGDPGSATASLLTDDNRLPTDATTIKLRLINGVTGSTGTLTFTANSASVASGIAAGAASSFVSVTGSSTAMTLSLYSSAASGTYYTTSTTLNVDNVYTVMAAGPFASPQLLIR